MELAKMQLGFVIIFSLLSQTAISQSTASLSPHDFVKLNEATDNYLKAWARDDSPGFSIGVVKDGQLVYKKGFGLSDLEHGTMNNEQTVFNIASLSKQFTAMAILLLEEEGRLSLQDDIRKYFPGLRDYGKIITIDHLLTHTSGLRETSTLLSLAARNPWGDNTTNQILKLIKAQKNLNFPVGEEFMYCNTGYFLLAEVVKSVSGKSFSDFTRERIFEPLGMTNTFFYDDRSKIVKNRAFAYDFDEDGNFVNAFITDLDRVGPGGVHTTIEDFVKWDNNFYHNRLGKRKDQEIIRKLEQKGQLNNGAETRYGRGIFISDYKGVPNHNHNGQVGNYTSSYFRFPTKNISVYLFGNHPRIAVHLYDIYELYANGVTPKAPVTVERPKEVQLNEHQARKFAGLYFAGPGRVLQVSFDEQLSYRQVGTSRTNLVHVGDNSFVNARGDYRLSFETDSLGNVTSVVPGYPALGMSAPRAKKLQGGDAQLRQYEGSYCSDELDVCYNAVAADGTLKMQIDGDTIIEVAMDESGTFHGSGITMSFQKDESGQASGFTVTTGRLRNLAFEKK